MRKTRKFLFSLIMMIMVIAFLELIGNITYYIMHGYRYSFNNYLSHMNLSHDAPADILRHLDKNTPLYLTKEILHPYIGYVPIEYIAVAKQYFDILKKSKEKLIIAVIGGSVAFDVTPYIEKQFKIYFKKNGNKIKPIVIPIVAGGLKQPQQLLAISYFLSMGTEFDIIINVDGFNEVVLPYNDNYRFGVFPFYPRSWAARVNRKISLNHLSLIGKAKYLREYQADLIDDFRSSFFKSSAIYGLFNAYLLKTLNHDIINTDIKISKSASRTGGFEATGPYKEYKDIKALYLESVDVWFNSSLLLYRLSSTQAFEYYHFLQPNQYVTATKPLSKNELKHAFKENHPYRKSVLIGYPILINKGRQLKKHGVKFFDLTKIFYNTDETVYRDDCCHFNERGNTMMAQYIVNRLIENTEYHFQ